MVVATSSVTFSFDLVSKMNVCFRRRSFSLLANNARTALGGPSSHIIRYPSEGLVRRTPV